MGKCRTCVLLLAAFAVATAAAAKDLRTAMLRLVPETNWVATPGPVAVVVENRATHAEAAEFTAEFDKWLRESLRRLKFTVDDAAPTRLVIVIHELDPGNAGLRFAVGFGAGKSYVRGSVAVEQAGQAVGNLQFTARPQGFTMNGMAKEVAPAVVLKLKNGERDTELHEPNPPDEEEAAAKS
jgi:hypothetical protein